MSHKTIISLINSIRAKHPDAEKPDPDGEPPWHKMGDDYEPQPDTCGEIECPNCKSKIQYRISSYNGHLMAACSTDGCIRFMQ